MPRMATVSPGRAPLLRSALKVVTPAHISGAASTSVSSSGISASALAGAIDVVGIAAVKAYAGNLLVLAEDEVAAAAGRAVVAVAAMPAQAHALAGLEERHIWRHRIHNAGHLVARYARIGNARKNAELGDGIAMANAAGLYADAHMSGPRFGKFLLHHFKGSAGGGDLHCTSKNGRH